VVGYFSLIANPFLVSRLEFYLLFWLTLLLSYLQEVSFPFLSSSLRASFKWCFFLQDETSNFPFPGPTWGNLSALIAPIPCLLPSFLSGAPPPRPVLMTPPALRFQFQLCSWGYRKKTFRKLAWEKEERKKERLLIWYGLFLGFLFCEKVLVEGVSCTQETAEGFRLPGSIASV